MEITKSMLKKLSLQQASDLVSWGIQAVKEKAADLEVSLGNISGVIEEGKRQYKTRGKHKKLGRPAKKTEAAPAESDKKEKSPENVA